MLFRSVSQSRYLTNYVGCDSVVSTTVNILPTSSRSQTVNICPGGSVFVGTSTYTTAGTFTNTFTNYVGCDSVVTTTVNILPTSSRTQTVNICPGGSVVVGTSTYTTAGTYTNTFTNYVGCDSVVTTIVNILPTSSRSQTINICPGGSVVVGTSTYSTAGTFTNTFTNYVGCDIVTGKQIGRAHV